MKREPLQDRFSGPYCQDCKDESQDDADRCACREARCVMPRCSIRVAKSRHPPVPVSLLLWRVSPSRKNMVVSPGWACSAACLFGFARAVASYPRSTGRSMSAEQAAKAATMLTELQAAYLGAEPADRTGEPARRDYSMDPRIWKVISKEQLHTIERATEYAHMASVP